MSRPPASFPIRPELASASAAGGWISAHCDGGARGNPGPAGFGALVQDADGHVLAELSEFLGIQTNNFAEYSGLLAVARLCPGPRPPAAARGLGLRADGEADSGQVQGEEPRSAAAV